MNSNRLMFNDDKKITLPRIKNTYHEISMNTNSVRNMNSYLINKFSNHTNQKLNEDDKLTKRNLIIDSHNSPWRKFENDREDHIVKNIKKSFVNFDRQKNHKILYEIQSLINSFKDKEYDYINNPNIEDSLLNTFKNFVIFKRKKEFDDGMPILKIKQNEFLENLNKSEKVFYI